MAEQLMAESLEQQSRNLFIVGTPLQLLNATEARDRFHSRQCNTLAVVRTPLRRGAPMAGYLSILEDLIDDRWTDVWFPKLSKIRQAAFSLVAKPFIRQSGRFDIIYTGSFQSAQNHLINSLGHTQLALLDDGCSIHHVLERYLCKSRKRRLRDCFLRRRGTWPDDPYLRVFTCFHVQWPSEWVVRNDYRMLRRRTQGTTELHLDELVFISQPIQHELGIKIDHDELRNRLMEEAGVSRIRWINHPKEPDPPVFGEYLPYPIELFGIREKYLPAAFATFFSSAIRTLSLLYRRKSYCVEIPDHLVTNDTDYALSQFYEDYRQDGVQLLPYELGSPVARAA
jgi:hypothetical protein